MSTLYWDDSRIIHQLLQIFGLAPYRIAAVIENSRLSTGLSLYNLCLAVLVAANLIYSESDPRNTGTYVNKTQVVDTAFDAVDWLGNFYVASSMLLSIAMYKNNRRVFFAIRGLEARCAQMGVTASERKNRNYLIAKMVATLFGTAIIMGLDIYFEGSTKFTVTYWICVLTPMAEASVVTLVFGATSSILYQKLWITNEYLKRVMDEYITRQISAKPPVILLNYEKSLETIILNNNYFQKTSQIPEIRPKPYLVFIDNYPQCFEKENINILKELNHLRDYYNNIIETASLINKFFGPHFLFLFPWYFLGVVINVYSTVTFHVKGDFTEEYGARIVLTVTYLYMAFSIVAYTSLTTDEAKETMATVLKFATKIDQNDDILKREFQHFIIQLAHNPMEFTAAGFFKVNSGLLFSFAIGVITNVIFIVQFDKLNFQTPND